MSESEAFINNIIEAAKKEIEGLAGEVLPNLSSKEKLALKEISEEYAGYLRRSRSAPDAVAERNLAHLRAQVMLTIARHEIAVSRETMDMLQRIVVAAARIALKALMAAIA
jgi:hypothetical protein